MAGALKESSSTTSPNDSHADPFQQLQACLNRFQQAPYPDRSRIHLLRSFSFAGATCFVKREDELGFGLSGSKIRKYRTLIPFLLKGNIKEAIVIGSAFSNHVLSLSQLLIENRIPPTLFLRGRSTLMLNGNALLSSLFVPSDSIHWISKDNWKDVQELASRYALARLHPTAVIPEGACMVEAFPGALSLTLDIIRNEHDVGFSFDHVMMDSGTGLMAIATLLAFSWLGKSTHLHILLMAGTEVDFRRQLAYFHTCFCSLIQEDSLPFPERFTLYSPQQFPRFGQVHPVLFQEIIQLARTEGFLTDPIYTGKLFRETKRIIAEKGLVGKILIIHSGGALTLMGFEEQLRQAMGLK